MHRFFELLGLKDTPLVLARKHAKSDPVQFRFELSKMKKMSALDQERAYAFFLLAKANKLSDVLIKKIEKDKTLDLIKSVFSVLNPNKHLTLYNELTKHPKKYLADIQKAKKNEKLRLKYIYDVWQNKKLTLIYFDALLSDTDDPEKNVEMSVIHADTAEASTPALQIYYFVIQHHENSDVDFVKALQKTEFSANDKFKAKLLFRFYKEGWITPEDIERVFSLNQKRYDNDTVEAARDAWYFLRSDKIKLESFFERHKNDDHKKYEKELESASLSEGNKIRAGILHTLHRQDVVLADKFTGKPVDKRVMDHLLAFTDTRDEDKILEFVKKITSMMLEKAVSDEDEESNPESDGDRPSNVTEIDNPGRGNCGIYAFAKGAIPIWKLEILNDKESFLGQFGAYIGPSANCPWKSPGELKQDILFYTNASNKQNEIILEKFHVALRNMLVSLKINNITAVLYADEAADQKTMESFKPLKPVLGIDRLSSLAISLAKHSKGNSTLSNVMAVFDTYVTDTNHDTLETNVAKDKDVEKVIQRHAMKAKALEDLNKKQKELEFKILLQIANQLSDPKPNKFVSAEEKQANQLLALAKSICDQSILFLRQAQGDPADETERKGKPSDNKLTPQQVLEKAKTALREHQKSQALSDVMKTQQHVMLALVQKLTKEDPKNIILKIAQELLNTIHRFEDNERHEICIKELYTELCSAPDRKESKGQPLLFDPHSVLYKSIEKERNEGVWIEGYGLMELAHHFQFYLKIIDDNNPQRTQGENSLDLPTICIENQSNAHWVTLFFKGTKEDAMRDFSSDITGQFSQGKKILPSKKLLQFALSEVKVDFSTELLPLLPDFQEQSSGAQDAANKVAQIACLQKCYSELKDSTIGLFDEKYKNPEQLTAMKNLIAHLRTGEKLTEATISCITAKDNPLCRLIKRLAIFDSLPEPAVKFAPS